MAKVKRPKPQKTRIVKRKCWQCRSTKQVFENGSWFCENKCGPKGLADLMRF